jgi:hypothetical protein
MSAFSPDNFPDVKKIIANVATNSIVDYYQDFGLPMIGKQPVITRRTTDTAIPYKVTQNTVNSSLFKSKDAWF